MKKSIFLSLIVALSINTGGTFAVGITATAMNDKEVSDVSMGLQIQTEKMKSICRESFKMPQAPGKAKDALTKACAALGCSINEYCPPS